MTSTYDRVSRHSPFDANAQIREDMQVRVRQYTRANHNQISARIKALEREWDIERVLETNAATVALVGLGLGTLVDRRWLALPVVVAGFLLQHAVQGWCPPLPLFRRLGVRTAAEIHQEIVALKVLRGDFEPTRDGDAAIEQAALH